MKWMSTRSCWNSFDLACPHTILRFTIETPPVDAPRDGGNVLTPVHLSRPLSPIFVQIDLVPWTAFVISTDPVLGRKEDGVFWDVPSAISLELVEVGEEPGLLWVYFR